MPTQWPFQSGDIPVGQEVHAVILDLEDQAVLPIPADAYNMAVWSASLPLELVPYGTGTRQVRIKTEYVRPWNGRALSREERRACLEAFRQDWERSRTMGSATQAAYEYLSATCW